MSGTIIPGKHEEMVEVMRDWSSQKMNVEKPDFGLAFLISMAKDPCFCLSSGRAKIQDESTDEIGL